MSSYTDDVQVTFICPECGAVDVIPYKSARQRKYCPACARRADALARQRWLECKAQKAAGTSENMQSIARVARAAAQAGVSYGVYVAWLKEQAERDAREKAALRPLPVCGRSGRANAERRRVG